MSNMLAVSIQTAGSTVGSLNIHPGGTGENKEKNDRIGYLWIIASINNTYRCFVRFGNDAQADGSNSIEVPIGSATVKFPVWNIDTITFIRETAADADQTIEIHREITSIAPGA